MLETQIIEMKENVGSVLATAESINDGRFTVKLEIIQSLQNIIALLEDQYKLITPQVGEPN